MALTVIKSSGTNFLGNTSIDVGTRYAGQAAPLLLNDITPYFDGVTAVFPLKLDYTSISTIVDSKDLQVVLNGQILAPYVNYYTWPWIVIYDSYKGYKVSGSNLIIYNAPGVGDQATLIVSTTSTSKQYRRYPFSATTIALGD